MLQKVMTVAKVLSKYFPGNDPIPNLLQHFVRNMFVHVRQVLQKVKSHDSGKTDFDFIQNSYFTQFPHTFLAMGNTIAKKVSGIGSFSSSK